jgi:hypothetical protein
MRKFIIRGFFDVPDPVLLVSRCGKDPFTINVENAIDA